MENLRWGGLPLVANSQLLAARSAAASQYGAAVLGFHANAKTMGFRAMAIVRLKSTFGHFSSIIQYKALGEGLGIGAGRRGKAVQFLVRLIDRTRVIGWVGDGMNPYLS